MGQKKNLQRTLSKRKHADKTPAYQKAVDYHVTARDLQRTGPVSPQQSPKNSHRMS